MTGKRRNRRNPGAAQMIGALKSKINGHPNVLRGLDAPTLTEKVYYQQVIRVEITSATNFTPASICSALAVQIFPLSVAGDTDLLSALCFKLERMDIWATAVAGDTARPSATLTAYSTDANAGTIYSVVPILKTIKDIGTLSSAARCSYTWPMDMVETPLSFLSDAVIASAVFNTSSAEVRFHLRWSPIGALIVE